MKGWVCHGQHALDEHDRDTGRHDRGDGGCTHMPGMVGGACEWERLPSVKKGRKERGESEIMMGSGALVLVWSHEDFPSGHPTWYYPRANTLSCRVLMGSGALVLVWSHLTCNVQKLHLTHAGRHDQGDDWCTHVLGTNNWPKSNPNPFGSF